MLEEQTRELRGEMAELQAQIYRIGATMGLLETQRLKRRPSLTSAAIYDATALLMPLCLLLELLAPARRRAFIPAAPDGIYTHWVGSCGPSGGTAGSDTPLVNDISTTLHRNRAVAAGQYTREAGQQDCRSLPRCFQHLWQSWWPGYEGTGLGGAIWVNIHYSATTT
jgi:hypothetical protein